MGWSRPGRQGLQRWERGARQVTICGSNYDLTEPESFSPYHAILRFNKPEGGWSHKRLAFAHEENTLGLDTKSDLVGKMTEAFEAWACMTTPPPKAADPTVKALVQSYLDNGGQINTFDAYRTTPDFEDQVQVQSSP